MKTILIIYTLIIVIVLAIAIPFLFLHLGGPTPPEGQEITFPYTPPAIGAPSSPMQGTLTLLAKPLLGIPVSLVFKFKSATPAPNTEAKIELPDGFESVSGIAIWTGDLTENQEQQIEIVIRAVKVGYYQLKGSAFSQQEGLYFGDTDIIDIEITANDAIPGSRPENNWYEPSRTQAVPISQNNQLISSQLLISDNPALNQEFTVVYRVVPGIDLPDGQRNQMSLVFPPRAFEIVSVEFPHGGEIYQHPDQLSWKGSIARDQAVEIRATFKVINTGWGVVYGDLNVQASGNIPEFISDAKIANLYVDEYGGSFTLD